MHHLFQRGRVQTKLSKDKVLFSRLVLSLLALRLPTPEKQFRSHEKNRLKMDQTLMAKTQTETLCAIFILRCTTFSHSQIRLTQQQHLAFITEFHLAYSLQQVCKLLGWSQDKIYYRIALNIKTFYLLSYPKQLNSPY